MTNKILGLKPSRMMNLFKELQNFFAESITTLTKLTSVVPLSFPK